LKLYKLLENSLRLPLRWVMRSERRRSKEE
jgi:hypothetical protein